MTQTVVSQTLYRKYRPTVFEDIFGQDEVVSILKNSIEQGSISHSYLFSGTRGTGKTSIARIFAKELGTSEQDIYEIDAASNRGIGEIRELRAGVDTRPFNSQYKVYIIDEVHMLTKEAFNALLKTLEEPPSHVLFILATTEKHKVLDTILSRCQVFDFKHATTSDGVRLIKKICKQEGRVIDDESAEFIAGLGNGSFRDTLSYLQKSLAYIDGDLTIDVVAEKMNILESNMVIDFIKLLSKRDKDAVFALYNEFQDMHIGINTFIDQALIVIRNTLLVRYSKSHKRQIEATVGEEVVNKYEGLIDITSKHLQDFITLATKMKDSQNSEAIFEVYLFSLFEK